MKKLLLFLNPMDRLGLGKYSRVIPIIGTLIFVTLVELFVTKTPIDISTGSTIIITSSILLVIYFSFRDGIIGGLGATTVVFLYYFFIIFTRIKASQHDASINTAVFLTVVYLAIGIIIGWLKQSIDYLILREKKARIQIEEEKLRLKNILEHLPIAIRIANIKEKKIEGNKKLEELLQKKFGEDYKSDIKYIADHEYKKGHKLKVNDLVLMKSFKSKKKITSSQIDYVRDDNKHLNLQISAAPIFNKKHELTSVVSVLSDMTAEHQLQERKNNFINMASHELKTPITSMKLYLDLLLKRSNEIENESLKVPITNLIIQTERLQQLASDLLDASRVQTGKLHFVKQEFQLNELIAEVAHLFGEVRHDKKIIHESTKPITVTADRFRIYQVLTNLVTNAIKYSEKGGEIIIQSKKSNGHVQVSVKDFGIGIEKNKRNKIFNLLYQVKDDHTKTYPGLGMGLFISKQIIKKHKGKIWVESTKGKGSTFYFTIPVGGKN